MTTLRGGTTMPSGTSAPAATIDSSPTTAPFRTIAPMPTRQRRSIVQPCRVTRVADRDVLGQRRRVLGRDVEDAVVLDVRPGPDADPVHVAPDHRVHPDARVLAQLDRADHLGGARPPRPAGPGSDAMPLYARIMPSLRKPAV